MARHRARTRGFTAHLEQLEDRRYMTADPLADPLGAALVHHDFEAAPPLEMTSAAAYDATLPPLDQHVTQTPDFWADSSGAAPLDAYLGRIEQMLTASHQQTGWYNVQSNYGFTGRGQTVAVIDSGIAYDHPALGGGLGAGRKVVGGWDYTESDADPYDDGGAGSHGTHVAGIIGSNSTLYPGVAQGVDLVGVRVFSDTGAGYFSWVEYALKWVHLHRNDYANPITTINLSLGVSSWNADTVPSWSTLEDEFAQLKADGIFIAVSAGNSYGSYNTPGLSYPASSPNVVPVMAVDEAGNLTGYSQRLARAIAAPGQNIVSTVPDYNGNNNGVTDDFGAKSGTSMASPYVAGASVLIRQAMQFVGMSGINEDTIYNHMMATADAVVDAASGISYKRLNLQRAIDALMPTDDYGSTLASAYNMGTLSGNQTYSGVISKLSDVDMFKFTAGATGQVSFTATTLLENMTPSWQVFNSAGTVVASGAGSSIAFSATQGQAYTVSLGSSGGLGHYTFGVSSAAQAPFSFTDWGSVSFGQVNNVAAAGVAWYRVQTTQAGYLTAQGAFNAAAGNVTVDLYDANQQLVASGSTASGLAKVNALAAANTQYYVRVSGTSSDVDFTLCNLVSRNGTTVTVNDSSGDDQFIFSAGTNHSVTVNGVAYSFLASQVNAVNFVGGAGTDSVVYAGTAAVDTATLRFGSSSLSSSTYSATAEGVETSTALGGGGADVAYLYDSAGDDVASTYANYAVLTGQGGTLLAWSFSRTEVIASTGNDIVHMYDSAGDDMFDAYADHSIMTGVGFSSTARGFDAAIGYASTGNDMAYSHDTAGDDVYDVYKDRAAMFGAGYATHALNFDVTTGFSTTGNDRAYFHDSTGDDVFDAYSDRVVMTGAGYTNHARNFDFTVAIGSGGVDRAYLHDSSGDDVFDAYDNRATIYGTGYSNHALNFDFAVGYATTGNDRAYLHDSAGDDVCTTSPTRASLVGAGYSNTAEGFDGTYALATTGNDIVYASDSTGDDIFNSWETRSVIYGSGYLNYSQGFDKTFAYASTGNDRAYFNDGVGDDLYRAWSDRAIMSGANFYNFAQSFDGTYAFSTNGGSDTAYLYDTAGSDTFYAWSNKSIMSGAGYFSYLERFAKVYGISSGGADVAYLYDTSEADSYYSKGNQARMSGAGFRNEAQNFGNTLAFMTTGADDVAFEDTTVADLLTIRNWGAVLAGSSYRNEVRGCRGLTATSLSGGADAKDVAAVDYIFNLVGTWA